MSKWHGYVWSIGLGDPNLGEADVIKAGNEFTLKPKPNSRKITYYEVHYKKKMMTRAWHKCVLFPRGSVPPPLLSAPLPPNPTPEEVQAAGVAILNAIASSDDYYNTLRLEGDIRVNGKREAATLMQIKGGFGGALPLLIVRIRCDLPHNEDGSASGHGQK